MNTPLPLLGSVTRQINPAGSHGEVADLHSFSAYGPYAAATVLGSIPLILLVMAFQKPIVSGLTSGAVKG